MKNLRFFIFTLFFWSFNGTAQICNPAGNLIIYSNYDGGILTINVDQNIPNLKVGICTYEPIQVNFTGPFVGNITQVIYAGKNSSQNNNNCGLGNFPTTITGVPAAITTISPPMNPPQVGYVPAHGNGAGPWGAVMLGAAGFCDTLINTGGVNTPDEIVYYFLNATGGTLFFHKTQYNCWINETVNVSAGGTCCILPPNANPCSNPVTPSFTQVAPICSGGIFTLPTSSNNGVTGTWSPALNNTATTTYTFTPTAGQCASPTTMTVNVNPSTTPTFTTWGPYCQNEILIQVMLPTTSNEGITGTWNPGMVSTAVAGNIVHTFTPNPGQCANTTTMTVIVNPLSAPQFNPIEGICVGEQINLPSSANNGISGTWSPAINNTATTTYTFTPNAGQCATSTDLTVQVNPAPIVSVLPSNPIIALGGTVQLSANGANSYFWTNASTLSCSACPTPIANPLATTTYVLTGTNTNGCSDTASVTVFVDGVCNEVFIPTRFSPNESGPSANNVFRVFGNCIQTMQISVYNRWGERVFESMNQAETWDGTFRGKPLNSGVYVYTFSATLFDGTQVNTSGSIEIMR
jgi:gliding motility-associated-like protein